MQKPFLALLFATASAVVLHVNAGAIPANSRNQSVVPLEVVPSPPAPSRDEVIRFWTPARMEAAWPPGPGFDHRFPIEPPLDARADQSGYTLVQAPYANRPLSRITGILFFHASSDPDDGLHHCSASVIHSRSGNLILTAAHCIYQAHVWHDMLMFVPAFNGTQPVPFEKWPIRVAFMPGQDAPGSPETDIAVGRVYSLPSGKTLEAEVAGSFQPHASTTEVFPLVKDMGYPSYAIPGDGPYLYAQQRECDSHTRHGEEFKSLVLLNCAPQQGNSGGPIVRVYSSPIEVVAVFAKITPEGGQPRLLPDTFIPIYQAADSLSP